eukprot:gnl/Spiro4/2755_TR1341_c0_g1_i1.p1 gnl/Spiro4/2755_TR1341_c0_g1~~gnl/Spiro4/2755_TR1341_c0_g1_i1.p1  ORF type:complete len:147 (+),score=24.35 gnl/Spiro4/2755_TR1341_c0_g1_i1:69-443(+)
MMGDKALLLLVRGEAPGTFCALYQQTYDDDAPFKEVALSDLERVAKVERLLALLPDFPAGSWRMDSPTQPTCRPITCVVVGAKRSSCYNYQSGDKSQYDQSELPPESFCRVVDLALEIANTLPR